MIDPVKANVSATTAVLLALSALLGGDAANSQAPSPPVAGLAAQEVGVRRCLPAITAIAQRATSGATMQDIIVNWNRAAPDTSAFFSMTGMGTANQRAALTIVAVPSADGKCAVLVERISSTAGDCAAIAGREFANYPSARLIDGIMVYQRAEVPDETFTLIQNGGSCLVIRRQAMFNWGQRP